MTTNPNPPSPHDPCNPRRQLTLSLPPVDCLPSTAHCPLPTVDCSPPTVDCSPSTVHCLLSLVTQITFAQKLPRISLNPIRMRDFLFVWKCPTLANKGVACCTKITWEEKPS